MRQIIGPDVSFYQDDPGTPQEINFVRMNEATDFVIIRAGQNIWIDSDFKNNWRRAKEVALPRGSYWFYDSRANPREQAELWFNALNGDLGELPLFLDIEEAYGGSFTGWQHWKTFLDRLRTLVGSKEIGIYTAYHYWNNNAPINQPNELEYFHRYPLWIANYGVAVPLVPRPWTANEWLFWQFTASGDGPFYGVESLEIDLNFFNGDAEAFARRFGVPAPTDPIPPDPAGNRYRVNAGSLYVREGPGTNFKAIGFLRRNEIVEALEANLDGTWLRVRRLSDGLTGWASSAFLVRVSAPPPPPPPPPTPTGDRYRVTAGTLYVREGPGTNFKALGFLRRNDIVEALEFNADQSWIRVRRVTDGLTGWSSSTFLDKITPAPPPPPPPVGDKYRVTASRLHVRVGPGTEFASLGFLEFNEVITAIGVNEDGTWRQVRRSDGLTGWSSARFLVLVPPAPPPGPTEPPSEVTGNWYRVTGKLNVREGPGTNFKAVDFLSKDEVVEALSANADQSWIQFRRVDGWSAWASSGFLVNVGKTPASIMQMVYTGVTYYRKVSTSPRRMIAHVLEIDMQSDGLRFLVTPPLRNILPQLCTRTTSQFLNDHEMQIAINGDAFYYLDPADYPPGNYCPDGGDPVRLVGYAASRGRVYFPKEPGRPILYINQRNEITFDVPKGRIYNAISGERMLVSKGRKVAGLDTQQLHPRTALGIIQNGRRLYLAVVDGREISEGATYSELADLLLSHGVYTAMSFDGGGSSTMVIEDVDRLPRVLNTPVNENTPGRERAVANHLGISLKK